MSKYSTAVVLCKKCNEKLQEMGIMDFLRVDGTDNAPYVVTSAPAYLQPTGDASTYLLGYLDALTKLEGSVCGD